MFSVLYLFCCGRYEREGWVICYKKIKWNERYVYIKLLIFNE